MIDSLNFRKSCPTFDAIVGVDASDFVCRGGFTLQEDMLEKEKIVVAYLDYNVIYYKEKENEPQLLQFTNAKLAVDRYMEIIERLRDDEMLIEDEGELVLEDV